MIVARALLLAAAVACALVARRAITSGYGEHPVEWGNHAVTATMAAAAGFGLAYLSLYPARPRGRVAVTAAAISLAALPYDRWLSTAGWVCNAALSAVAVLGLWSIYRSSIAGPPAMGRPSR
jgi:hypothetical protein